MKRSAPISVILLSILGLACGARQPPEDAGAGTERRGLRGPVASRPRRSDVRTGPGARTAHRDLRASCRCGRRVRAQCLSRRGRRSPRRPPGCAQSALGPLLLSTAMFRRPGSPVAVVSALALTIATLLAGAWDSSGHGHDLAAASAAYCAVDHEAEGAAASDRATVGEAASLHDHSCVACKLGRSQPPAEHRRSIAAALDLVSAGPGSGNGESPRNGESWQHTARGPPRS